MAETATLIPLIVIVPAYNEEHNLGLFLERLRTLPAPLQVRQVFVIDDGSQDQTGAIAEAYTAQLPVQVIRHTTNQGVGQAFRTGFAAALAIVQPADVIVTIEADNTGDLGILPDMVQRIAAGADLVLASCYAVGGGIAGTNWFRMFLSKSTNWLLKLAYPHIHVATYSSFYRVYRPAILQRAVAEYGQHFIEEPGFVCMVEILVKLSRLTGRISEVPMVLRTGARIGSSKMKILRTISGYIHFIGHDLVSRRKRHDIPEIA